MKHLLRANVPVSRPGFLRSPRMVKIKKKKPTSDFNFQQCILPVRFIENLREER